MKAKLKKTTIFLRQYYSEEIAPSLTDVSRESEVDIPELPPSPHHQSLTEVSRETEEDIRELPPHQQSLTDVSRESEDDIPKLLPSPHHQSLTTVEDLLAGSDSDF